MSVYEERDNLKVEIKLLRGKIRELEAIADERSDECDRLGDIITGLNTEIYDLGSEMAAMQRQKADTATRNKKKFKGMKATIVCQGSRCDGLEEEVNELNERIEELEEDLYAEQLTLAEEREQHKKDFTNCSKKKMMEVNAEIKRLKEVIDRYRAAEQVDNEEDLLEKYNEGYSDGRSEAMGEIKDELKDFINDRLE